MGWKRCSFCGRKAEFFEPDRYGEPKLFLCPECARDYLRKGKANFLPRIKSPNPKENHK